MINGKDEPKAGAEGEGNLSGSMVTHLDVCSKQWQIEFNRIKGYYLDTWIEGSRYLHIWGSISLPCLTEECLIGQQGDRVVRSSKLLGISQSRRSCTFLTVKEISKAWVPPKAQILQLWINENVNTIPRAKSHHGSHSFACQYISGMDQTIEHLSCRFHQFILFLCKHITYQIPTMGKCLLFKIGNRTSDSVSPRHQIV